MTIEPTAAEVAAAIPPLAPEPVDSGDTSGVIADHCARVDARARAEADRGRAAHPAKREPPSWAALEERAAKVGGKLSGPIKPGRQIASAGIEVAGRRIIGCQAMDWDGLLPDQQDRLLRSQIGAALWVLEGGG